MGMPVKESLPKNFSLLASSGLNGKTITGVSAYQHGSTLVLELSYSGGSSFIKVKGFQVDSGGTSEFGTGTIIS